ncbi:hypothetical protein QE152_g23649 [Popillia japonica]|uniref:Uncharacterized protein n=1 Tax=Popillia japonica TaxID=7064 RepID=A0AAW1KDX5_POPJA
MKNKSKLKGSKHYIESDFTKSEEKIQKKLREIAKEEKVKGKIAVVKYQKIKIKDTLTTTAMKRHMNKRKTEQNKTVKRNKKRYKAKLGTWNIRTKQS